MTENTLHYHKTLEQTLFCHNENLKKKKHWSASHFITETAYTHRFPSNLAMLASGFLSSLLTLYKI